MSIKELSVCGDRDVGDRDVQEQGKPFGSVADVYLNSQPIKDRSASFPVGTHNLRAWDKLVTRRQTTWTE